MLARGGVGYEQRLLLHCGRLPFYLTPGRLPPNFSRTLQRGQFDHVTSSRIAMMMLAENYVGWGAGGVPGNDKVWPSKELT